MKGSDTIADKLIHQIKLLLHKDKIPEIKKILSQVKEWNKELLVVNVLVQVFQKEIENGISPTVFDYSLDLDVLIQHFIHLKLYVRRLDFDLPPDLQIELYKYCKTTGVSDYLLLYIIQKNVFMQVKVCQKLSAIFAAAEGENSARSEVYRELAVDIAQAGGI